MASATLSRLAGRQLTAELFTREVAENDQGSWQRDHANAMSARDVEDWVALFVEEAAPLGPLSRNLHRRLRDNRLPLVEEVGQLLEAALDAFARLGLRVGVLIEKAGQAGHTIARDDEFRTALDDVNQELARVKRAWPRRDPAQAAESLEAMKAGQYQEVGDLIRELQG